MDENINNIQLESPVKQKRILTRETKRKIFYYCMIAYSVIQFLVFWVYINTSAISLAFLKFTEAEGELGWDTHFVFFDNFKKIIEVISYGKNWLMLRNSVLLYVLNQLLGTTLTLAFSYYVYKKYMFATFFRVVLFMPSVIPALIMMLLFKYMVEDVYKVVFNAKMGLLSNIDTRLGTIIFYNLFLSFAGGVLMYSSAMGGISDSIVESANLDGANIIQEFFHITFPCIFPTFTTFFVTGLAGIFTNQMGLYTFYVEDAPEEIQTVGYFLYVQTLHTGKYLSEGKSWRPGVPYTYLTNCELSALGLMISAVLVPTTYLIRHFFEKYGPSAE